MFLKVVTGEIGVAFHHIDDYRPPSFDVTRLGLIEEIKGAYYIGTESGITLALAWTARMWMRTGSMQLPSLLDFSSAPRLRRDTFEPI